MAFVTLTVVHDQLEAEQLCGLLRGDGIRCIYRRTAIAQGAWVSPSMAGPTEVLVDQDDLERARELLAAAAPVDPDSCP